MARAATKDDLIASASTNINKLWLLIDGMSDEERGTIFLFEDRDKNVRDVLVHLYEWHQLLIHWIEANRQNENKPFLPQPYNWKTYPEMNIKFWEKHQNTTYDEAVVALKQSHADVMRLIESFSDHELFTKKYFSWTGTTSLGGYCVSATTSHYEWAIKKLKKHIKCIRVNNE